MNSHGFKTREVSTIEALQLLGLERATSGKVMISVQDTYRGQRRHIRFRLRKGTGHRITRRGRLSGATVTEFASGPRLIEFHLS